jgi:ABC-type polysaccharide/polyol phosphate export permease
MAAPSVDEPEPRRSAPVAVALGLYEAAREVVASRELLLALAHRDLKIRYKQTAIGAAWALLMPLLMMLIFSLVFASRSKGEIDGVPYAVFALCGLLPWQFFASSLKGSVESLSRNSRLITKIYFPREVFPLSQVVASAADLAIASVLLGGMLLIFQVPIRATVVLLPVVLLVQVLLTVGLGLILSVGNLFFRDVRYILDFMLLPWMLASGVVCPVKVENPILQTLLALNPMAPIVDAYRDVLLLGRLPDPVGFGYAAALGAILAVIGLRFFHESEHLFAEVI